MIPVWAVLIPAGLLVAFMVLAFERRVPERALWLIMALAVLSVAALLLLPVAIPHRL